MSTLRAGYGKCEITPSIGCFMQGNPTRRQVEVIHDPLYARCVAFENDGLAVLMYFDVCGIPQNICDPMRQFVAESLGIEATNVFISATHTHTGPNLNNGMFPKDEAYIDSLKHYAARAARTAVNDLHPAQMYFNCWKVIKTRPYHVDNKILSYYSGNAKGNVLIYRNLLPVIR